MASSYAFPQAKTFEQLAPATLRSPAAPPWRPALQSASSNLLLTTPGVGQDRQQARRWPVGAWPDLPALVRLSARPKSDKHQGPSQQSRIACNITSRLPTHSLLQFEPEQGLSQK
eukprot:1147635-Pelagomonas_calceolata.AAC.1